MTQTNVTKAAEDLADRAHAYAAEHEGQATEYLAELVEELAGLVRILAS